MAGLWTIPYVQVFDSNADRPAALPGALLYFYDPGTTTTRTVYTDADLTTPHTHPVVADSAGRFAPIYLPTGDYKCILKDEDGSTIWTADNVDGPGDTTTSITTERPVTPVLSKTSAYTVLSADLGSLINANPTGGVFTITLISAVTAGDGGRIGIRHTGTANAVRILTASSQTISMSHTDTTTTAFSLLGYGHTVWLVSNGANWIMDCFVPPFMAGNVGIIPIIDRISSAPGSPVDGGRYIVTASYSTFETHDIIEYTGQTGSYIEYTPPSDCGWIAYVQDEDAYYTYKGSAWEEMAATQAVQETGTSVASFVTPGRQKFNPLHPKAWGRYNNSGTPTLVASSGVSSLTDSAVGLTGVNWTTAFSATTAYAGIACIGSDMTGTKASTISVTSYGTGGFRIDTYTATGTADTANTGSDFHVGFVALGDV